VGKVTLKVTLGPTGNVNEALVAKSTAKNPKVDQCVVDGFKKIKFPAPKAGATSVFTFPMEFGGAVEVK
jgi:TonB family protein